MAEKPDPPLRPGKSGDSPQNPGLEERVAKVQGILEDVRAGLNHLEAEIGSLRERMDRQFRWIIGLMVTIWVTVILSVLLAW